MALILSGNLYVAGGVLVLGAIVVTVGLRCPDRRKKIWANPVSYTHLDVYKRQEKYASENGLMPISSKTRGKTLTTFQA